MTIISEGQYQPRIIIRTSIGSRIPLDPEQHTQDHTQCIQKFIKGFMWLCWMNGRDVFPGFQHGHERQPISKYDSLVTLLIEWGDHYNENEIDIDKHRFNETETDSGKIYERPENGTFEVYYENGQLRYQWDYKDGERDGESKGWCLDGSLKQIRTFKMENYMVELSSGFLMVQKKLNLLGKMEKFMD